MAVVSSSSASATVAVVNATSDGLMSPDRTMNIDICKSIESNHWQAKDVVKAVKKRLQHKNPKLLDTMVKNCGDSVHSQIAEKKILEMMIKIVKKKRSGVEFPKHSLDAAPTFIPHVNHPTPGITTKTESLSLPSMEVIWISMKLLSDMLLAVNPSDPVICEMAVKKEVIVDLVNSCRSNQIKLVKELAITGNEELLCMGPSLNDSLLIVLAKYDAIASGASGASGASFFVIGPQYCDPSMVELEVSREARSTSNFVFSDIYGSVIFRVHREKDTMPGGVLVDRAGIPIVLIKKQFLTAHGRWVVYRGKSAEESNSIFDVRRFEVTREKTKLVVFLAANKKEKVCDFQMEESQSENLPIIYNGESSTKVAEMHKKAATEGGSTSEDSTMVKIYPNIDRAFIVTLIVIYECIKEIGEKRKENIHRAVEVGKVGLKVGATAGANMLCGLLCNNG